LMRSMAMPSLSHQTVSFDRLNSPLGLAKGTPLSADGAGQTTFGEQPLEVGEGELLAGGFQCFAHQQIARGVAGSWLA